jgi:carbon-monoxide dehydrogenase small subunit
MTTTGDTPTTGPSPTADPYALRVNGREESVAGAWLGESLLYVLRERLGHPGTKNACDQGECGSCTVLLDGDPVCACTTCAADAVDAEITTVEAVGVDGALSDVQQAFLDTGAVQCGFCTPGLIVATHALLDEQPDANESAIREAISGNLCRCTGYGRIIEAITTARDRRAGAA